MVAAAAVILSWQLFLPPIVGSADQGDFIRIASRFGYRAADKSAEYVYVARTYVSDPAARDRAYEQVSSEYIFAEAAILLNKLLSKDGTLDITIMGLVHLLAFLYAFHRLLLATGPLRAGPLIWILALLILTDVGYAAYWNSFYTEPASCIFLLLLLAESVAIGRTPEVSSAQVLRWTLWAILFVMAKAQNAPIGILLALFALRFKAWNKSPRAIRIALVSSLLIAAAAAINIFTIPLTVKGPNAYNSVFLAILPESKEPALDAQALGLSPYWLKYSGIGAWAVDSGYGDAVKAGVMGKTITPASVLRFYALRPASLWRHVKTVLPIGFSLRPEWCGNFERSTGLPPLARSKAFSLWSAFHEHALAACGKFILIALPICPVICVLAWFRWAHRRRFLEFFGLLSVCCLASFVVAICGDAWDNVKHLFLFNLLLDTWLVASVAVLFQSARNVLYGI
jgi:hypothetical protein